MSDYWKENDIEKPQQIVVCAAVKHGLILLCSARHWDTRMHDMYSALDLCLRPKKAFMAQGFIDQFGDFLTRKEAMKIVKASNQPFNIKRNGGNDSELYSEGLY